MIKVVKHGSCRIDPYKDEQLHKYKCGYYRSTGDNCGGCGCEFTATLKDFEYSVVGHGQMDYITICPECFRTIYDSINRVD